jgi:hypothetical protein
MGLLYMPPALVSKILYSSTELLYWLRYDFQNKRSVGSEVLMTVVKKGNSVCLLLLILSCWLTFLPWRSSCNPQDRNLHRQCFPKQYQPVGLSNEEADYFLQHRNSSLRISLFKCTSGFKESILHLSKGPRKSNTHTRWNGNNVAAVCAVCETL